MSYLHSKKRKFIRWVKKQKGMDIKKALANCFGKGDHERKEG